jgi:hypothetical protein
MNSKINNIFLWLKNRCIFKYQENNNSSIIKLLNSLYRYIEDIEDLRLEQKNLDKIISKYYFDFDMEKSNDSDGFIIGFSEKDRQLLRHNIKLIYKDIIESLFHKNFEKQNINDTNINIFDEPCIENLISNTK